MSFPERRDLFLSLFEDMFSQGLRRCRSAIEQGLGFGLGILDGFLGEAFGLFIGCGQYFLSLSSGRILQFLRLFARLQDRVQFLLGPCKRHGTSPIVGWASPDPPLLF